MKRMTRLAAKLDKAIDIDDNGKVEFGKDIEVDGAVRLSELASNFTEGKLPIISAKSLNSDVVSTTEGRRNSGSNYNFVLSPCFYARRDSAFAQMNPRFFYAYAKENTSQYSVTEIALQSTIAIDRITIRSATLVVRVSYLLSNFVTGNYVNPTDYSVTNYTTLVKALKTNPNRFIGVSGATSAGTPLTIIASGTKAYLRVVNSTTFEESDVEIPADATITVTERELLSKK